jgi:hypothetical protein
MQGWPAPQTLPQDPQLRGPVSRWAQLSLQVVAPAAQEQLDATHSCEVEQDVPQAPQCCGSASASTQLFPHAVSEFAHVATHSPAWHRGVASEHACPQAPQLAGSAASSVHEPLHDASPDGHAQLPPLQAAPLGQGWSHVPQLAESVVSATHLEPHCVSPAAHGAWHVPAVQMRPASQTRPHEPQFFASLVRSKQVLPHAD